MCILCENLENTNPAHINEIIFDLNDEELNSAIEYAKKHLRNFQQILPLPKEEIKEIRRMLLRLLHERSLRSAS